MALDSFFVNEIAAAATHAANAYYNGSGGFPINPYEFGSEGAPRMAQCGKRCS